MVEEQRFDMELELREETRGGLVVVRFSRTVAARKRLQSSTRVSWKRP